MGKKSSSNSSNALAIQVDGDGKVKYDAIARQGHTESRIIHASFKDLIPLRQRAEAGDLNLDRPSQEEVEATAERTKNALAALVSGAVSAQKPKTIAGTQRKDPTFVRYTPASQMGDSSKKQDRIMKIVERQRDPMEPPKFKHKKVLPKQSSATQYCRGLTSAHRSLADLRVLHLQSCGVHRGN